MHGLSAVEGIGVDKSKVVELAASKVNDGIIIYGTGKGRLLNRLELWVCSSKVKRALYVVESLHSDVLQIRQAGERHTVGVLFESLLRDARHILTKQNNRSRFVQSWRQRKTTIWAVLIFTPFFNFLC